MTADRRSELGPMKKNVIGAGWVPRSFIHREG